MLPDSHPHETYADSVPVAVKARPRQRRDKPHTIGAKRRRSASEAEGLAGAADSGSGEKGGARGAMKGFDAKAAKEDAVRSDSHDRTLRHLTRCLGLWSRLNARRRETKGFRKTRPTLTPDANVQLDAQGPPTIRWRCKWQTPRLRSAWSASPSAITHKSFAVSC